MRLFLILILTCVVFQSYLLAQPAYHVAIDFPEQVEQGFLCFGYQSTPQGENIALLTDINPFANPNPNGPSDPIFWLKLNSSGMPINAFRLYEPNRLYRWGGNRKRNTIQLESSSIFGIGATTNEEGGESYSLVVSFNSDSQSVIAKITNIQESLINTGGGLSYHNNILISSRGVPDSLANYAGLCALSFPSLTSLWNYAYYGEVSNLLTQRSNSHYLTTSPNGNILVLGELDVAQEERNNLFIINKYGEYLRGIIFPPNVQGQEMVTDTNDNIFLTGLLLDQEQSTTSQIFLSKLSPNLELLWTKVISIEQSSATIPDISIVNGAEIYLTYTLGELNVLITSVLHQFSLDGDLLQQRAIHSGWSSLNSSVNNQGNWLLSPTTTNSPFPNRSFTPILSFTDTNLNLPDCPQYPVCPQVEDIDIEVEPWQAIRVPLDTLPNFPMVAEEIPAVSVPFCNVPPPPNAEFTLPDTICQYSCVSPADINNQVVPEVYWQVNGPGVDTTIQSKTFAYCFAQAGYYSLTQRFQMLGCEYEYTDSLYVLPDDLIIDLGEDTQHCLPEVVALQAVASRPLQGWLWSTDDTTSSLRIRTTGTYALTATDGYCQATDSIVHTFVHEQYPFPQVAIDTPRVALCPDLLPYLLRPRSAYGNSFYLLGDTLQSEVLEISQPGPYQVAIELDGCEFTTDFELTTVDCAVPIYLPTAFSPNRDGINDKLFPQGPDFAPLRLRVYDRWGDELLDRSQPPFAWDGSVQGKSAGQGVYLVGLTYRNLRTNKEEELWQEVTLLR